VIGTPDIEKKRQECIYELIYTEEDFTKDLNYMQDVSLFFPLKKKKNRDRNIY
jgi:hypothetical protein